MLDFINQTSTIVQICWYTAFATTFFFILQSFISAFGIEIEFDGDFDIDTDGDLAQEETGHSFQWFTIKNLIMFLMFFSWGTISFEIEGFSDTMSIFLGFLCGLFMTALVVVCFYLMSKLDTNNVPTMQSLPGKLGTVYLRIPKDGKGVVSIMLNGSVQNIDAISLGDMIPTGEIVKVVDVLLDDTILVESVKTKM